jgi:hypothetical protein
MEMALRLECEIRFLPWFLALMELKGCNRRPLVPACALTVQALTAERTLSSLVHRAWSFTAAEIALMGQAGLPRMPILGHCSP